MRRKANMKSQKLSSLLNSVKHLTKLLSSIKHQRIKHLYAEQYHIPSETYRLQFVS